VIEFGSIEREELEKVVRAMSIDGYNYGTSASSHWYECPNGHPYFIGDCGRAMQESTCNECSAQIGGILHQLLATYQPAGNLLTRERVRN
jgi:hypothetical protein